MPGHGAISARSQSMRLPDSQRLPDSPGTQSANPLAKAGASPGSHGPAGSAPLSSTLPPPSLKATDEELESPPSNANTESQVSDSHEQAGQLDEPPAKQGFFKGLMSKALSLVKGNADVVLSAGVVLGISAGVGGAAALLPALIGLAIGAAVVGALQTVKPEEDTTASSSQANVSPQRHEELERMRELERKLAETQAKLDAIMAAQDPGTAASPPAVQKSVAQIAKESPDFQALFGDDSKGSQ
jgi:uncharacterized protein HemX